MNAVGADLVSFWIAVAVHLWQTTLVLIPICCLAPWLRTAPARLAYGVWVIALVKILIPLAVVSALLRPLLAPLLPAAPGSAAAATLAAVSALFHPDQALDARAAAGDWRVLALALALTGAWAAGVIAALGALIRAHRAGHTPAARSLADCPPPIAARLRAAIDGTHIRPETIAVSTRSSPPHVAGFVIPRIVIPARLIECLTADELRGILLHEELHRRRRDPLRIALARCAAAVFFFYPLARHVLRRLAAATELLCDEGAVRAGAAPDALACAIAETVRLCLSPGRQPLAATLGGAIPLRIRFDRLTHPERYAPMKKHWFVLLVSLVLVAGGTLGPGWIAAGEKESAPAAFDKAPEPIPSSMTQPVYPEAEKKAGVEGMVILGVTITAKGEVAAMKAAEEVKDHPAFTKTAMAAIGQWRFKPAEKNGQPVACEVKIPVKFRLEEKATKS